jgi:riboflavin kinase / FMN adenylyltransferase
MRVVHIGRIEDIPAGEPIPILGMGTLDGVHVGHQTILRRVREWAAAADGTPAVLTFARHPLEVVRPYDAPPLLSPLDLKLALLARQGMGLAAVLHFSPALAALSAEDFVARMLVERLGVAGVCVGYDFGFGRGRQGDVALLERLAVRHGFRLEVVPPQRVDGEVVSSRRIRGLLASGDVAAAQRCLGRPYCLAGTVEAGAGRGRGLGFATANLPLPEPRLLADGVYAGRLYVRGEFREAMMNVGQGPTFGGGQRRLEVHLPGWEAPLYGERVLAFFLARLRDEIRFPDAPALVAQLARDREEAGAVWAAARALPWPEWALQP